MYPREELYYYLYFLWNIIGIVRIDDNDTRQNYYNFLYDFMKELSSNINMLNDENLKECKQKCNEIITYISDKNNKEIAEKIKKLLNIVNSCIKNVQNRFIMDPYKKIIPQHLKSEDMNTSSCENFKNEYYKFDKNITHSSEEFESLYDKIINLTNSHPGATTTETSTFIDSYSGATTTETSTFENYPETTTSEESYIIFFYISIFLLAVIFLFFIVYFSKIICKKICEKNTTKKYSNITI